MRKFFFSSHLHASLDTVIDFFWGLANAVAEDMDYSGDGIDSLKCLWERERGRGGDG